MASRGRPASLPSALTIPAFNPPGPTHATRKSVPSVATASGHCIPSCGAGLGSAIATSGVTRTAAWAIELKKQRRTQAERRMKDVISTILRQLQCIARPVRVSDDRKGTHAVIDQRDPRAVGLEHDLLMLPVRRRPAAERLRLDARRQHFAVIGAKRSLRGDPVGRGASRLLMRRRTALRQRDRRLVEIADAPLPVLLLSDARLADELPLALGGQ